MSASTHEHRGAAGRATVPGETSLANRGRVAGRAQVGRTYGRPTGQREPVPGGPGGGGPDGPNWDGPDWGGGSGRGGPRGGRRPRWGRIALVAAGATAVLLLLGFGASALYARKLNNSIDRTDPFAALTNGRPVKAIDGAINLLMVGSDSRDPDAPLDQGSKWRADTIIVMHVPASHDQAYMISIPRDLYVPIPQNAGGDCGNQRGKINAAFARGGLPLAVRTVECMTDIRMDHVIAIDFGGFKEVTDALGGVDLTIERNITSIHKPYRKFTKGKNHLTGAEALDYIRQRYQFPDGDFARMRHQQEFMRALMDRAVSTDTLANAPKLKAFLEATTKALTVDKDFSLVNMAVQFRSLRGDNLKFVTSPNKGGAQIDGESVVVSDREKALAMYQAVGRDKMAEWVQANVTKKPGR